MSLTIDQNTNRIQDVGYAYDSSGNLTNDTFHSYAYDAENRTKTVDSTGATYTYSGPLRVKKVAGGTTTVYIFSGSKPIAEYANGALSKEYVYAGGRLLTTVAADGTTTYQHSDRLSIRAETDAAGNVTRTFGHFPFGESWYETGTTNKWQFTSYERDSESGLSYAIFRYHSSRLGRFMSPDLLAGHISDPQSLNRYAYTRNDPIDFTDPLGLDCFARFLLTFDSKGHLIEVEFLFFWCDVGGGGGGGASAAKGLAGISKAKLLDKDKCKAFLGALAQMANTTVDNLVSQLQQTADAAQNFVYDGPSSSVPLDDQKFPGASSQGAKTVGQWFDQNQGSLALSQQNGAAIFIRANDWGGGFWSNLSSPFVSLGGDVNPLGMGLLTHESLHKDMVGGGFTHDQLTDALNAAGGPPAAVGTGGPSSGINSRIGQICF